MRGLKRVASLASLLILVLLIVGVVMIGVYGLMGRVFPLLVVKSGSMVPVLERGDIILIEEVNPDEIHADPETGDVIVFYRPNMGQLIVHRAIMKVERGFVTKGDANVAPDYWSPVPPEYIVGRWTGFKIPAWTGLGFLSLFLRGEIYPPYGRIVLLLLIVINVALIVKDLAARKSPS